MKYYLITTYTCYCGENAYYHLAVPEGEDIEDDKYQDKIADWVNDNASEWWDDQSEEEYDSYDDYLAECGYDIEEISEADYLADCDKE